MCAEIGLAWGLLSIPLMGIGTGAILHLVPGLAIGDQMVKRANENAVDAAGSALGQEGLSFSRVDVPVGTHR